MKYAEMNLEKPILDAILELGFKEPTEIQERAIPIIKKGADVMGQSETGSGKTAAFGLPILEKVKHGFGIQSLIMAPTRELAEQIAKNLRSFSKHKKVFITTVYGGVSMNPQIENLKSADIVVGTPGRLLDHLRRNTLSLSKIKFLVLDEADRMLDMGFIDDITQIISLCPKERQTLLFSATFNHDVQKIALRYMKNPEKIKTQDFVKKELLKQVYYDVPRGEKFSLLVHLMKAENPRLALVFCSTRREVDIVARNLYENGIKAMALHGGLSQEKRNRVMESFRNQHINILVASDVAARGLDIKDLTHIFNYSIPKTSKEYVHRVGRTARMGKSGLAINLLDEMDYNNFNAVLRDHSIKVEQMELPQFQRVFVKKFPERRPDRGFHRPMDWRRERQSERQNRPHRPRHDKPKGYWGSRPT